MLLLSAAIRLIVLATLLWLAVIDVRERRLPTQVVLGIGVLFVMDAIMTQMPWSEVLWHLGLAVLVFVICALLFAVNMLGGGDAKLAAMIFLWVGPGLYSLAALTLISIIGTVVSVISLTTRYIDPSRRSVVLRGMAMFSSERGVPYGVALALGGGVAIMLPAVLPYFIQR